MSRNLFLLFIFLAWLFCVWSDSSQEMESKAIERAFAHLNIGDELSAISELKVALAYLPSSKDIRSSLIKILAESSEDLEAIRLWKESCKLFQEFKEDIKLIEMLSWGVLQKAQLASQKAVKLSSLIGASATQDVKSVYFLKNAFTQSDSQMRMIAAKLSARFGDKVLIDAMKVALKKEKVWYVKLELIRSLARLRVKELTFYLEDILQDAKTTYEEKVIAAESLLMIYEDITPSQLQALIHSSRAGHRLFACQIISYLNLHVAVKDLIILLDDPSFEVKNAALMALSTIKLSQKEIEDIKDKIEELSSSCHNFVKLSALWLRSLYGETKSLSQLYDYVFHENEETRRLAGAFLARSGKGGEELALKALEKTTDLFVKANISYGLLGTSKNSKLLCKNIHQFLESYKDKVMWQFFISHNFKIITPSLVRHIPEMMNYPSLIDDQTRLSLLNILAIFRYPKADVAIKKYLKAKHLGSTFVASKALLEEGGQDAEEVIKNLLNDQDIHIRLQAGLVLALYGEDEQTFEVLKEAYYQVDKELKSHIIEAFGQLGSKKAIFFLVDLLDDPFNINRVLAASAIIQCIYH